MKAMIFDADGTLLDSMGLWRQIDRAFLKSHHYPYSERISEQVETMSLQQSAGYFQRLLRDREMLSEQQIIAELNGLCAGAYETEIQAMPFVPDFLEAAYQAGYRMCVATASQKEQISRALSRLGLLDYFSFVMDADEAGAAKTDPKIFLACADRLGSRPEETWVFEDAPHAAQTAASAGFLVIGVHAPGGKKQEELLKKCCFHFVPSFEMLIDQGKNLKLY
ncbi:MAG: HAD family phosphatase [Oscillospiraceae bacterium]|nr:HAD family phosphatase [Oscillospiraceae bacterium]